MKEKISIFNSITFSKIITLDQAHEMWVDYGKHLNFGNWCSFLKRLNYFIY